MADDLESRATLFTSKARRLHHGCGIWIDGATRRWETRLMLSGLLIRHEWKFSPYLRSLPTRSPFGFQVLRKKAKTRVKKNRYRDVNYRVPDKVTAAERSVLLRRIVACAGVVNCGCNASPD